MIKSLIKEGFKGQDVRFSVKKAKRPARRQRLLVEEEEEEEEEIEGMVTVGGDGGNDDDDSDSDGILGGREVSLKGEPVSDSDAVERPVRQHSIFAAEAEGAADAAITDSVIMDKAVKERKKTKKTKDKKAAKAAKKARKRKLKSYEKFQAAQERRGVVYISRVPPYMKPAKVQHLLEQYGPVTNMHLVEEDQSLRRRRRKAGGNSKKNYTEGWIEYESKDVAKSVARSLNNTQIGGKKSSYYYHDIWNLKYLSGFKWRHLTEKISYERRLREQKLRAEVNRAKRENNAFVAQVERAREIKKMEERKLARQGAGGGSSSGGGGSVEDERAKIRRNFRQNRPVEASRVREQLSDEVLGRVFSSGGKNKRGREGGGGGRSNKKKKKKKKSDSE